jgi:hypothetical protein
VIVVRSCERFNVVKGKGLRMDAGKRRDWRSEETGEAREGNSFLKDL